MTQAPPVGLPNWLLAIPPTALVVGVAGVALSEWGTSAGAFASSSLLVGSLGATVAVLMSMVLVPVGIYSLAKNPALRTPAQLALISLCALIATMPFLLILSAGI